MNTIVRCLLLMVALVALMIPATVSAQDTAAQNDGRLRIDLSGFNEVHGPALGIGTIFSTGRGGSRSRSTSRSAQSTMS